MGAFVFNLFSGAGLLCLGMYHLIFTTRSALRNPREYSARPYYHLNSSGLLKHLPLYLILTCLLISISHQTLISSATDPLVKGSTSVHRLSSLRSAAVLSFFLVIVIAILLSESTSLLPIPPDLFFLTISSAFALHFSSASSSSSLQLSNLQAKCDSVSAHISAASAILSLSLAINPKLFVSDLGLSASVCLQGFWVLQTGLSLYVDAFIPQGCHSMLDVASGIEGSTKCDLEEYKLRAVALLDLVFVIYVFLIAVIVMIAYGSVARIVGIRRFDTYEQLPTSIDSNIIQMKALTGTQA